MRFRLEGRDEPASVVASVYKARTRRWSDPVTLPSGELALDSASAVIAHPTTPGFWSLFIEDSRKWAAPEFPQVRERGPHGWWHRVHGVATTSARGAGIRIGVIDEALSRQTSTSCIQHIQNLGGVGWSSGTERAFSPRADHGHAVCCLLGARPREGTAGFQGIAYASDIVFMAAGMESAAALDPTRLANAIEALAQDQRCHLITVSAGDDPEPTPEIDHAVSSAREAGALCLFAAGNQGGEPMYPARYDSCLAVAACGQLGTAPERTTAWASEQQAGPIAEDGLFLWTGSARGPKVELIAAGVATFWCPDSNRLRPAIGTSYAAPVAAGVLAAELARNADYLQLPADNRRSQFALSILKKSCKSNGLTGIVAYGLPSAFGA